MGIHDGHRARKKEQFIQTGLDSFADHEALELLLFYAIPRRDTNPTTLLRFFISNDLENISSLLNESASTFTYIIFFLMLTSSV